VIDVSGFGWIVDARRGGSFAPQVESLEIERVVNSVCS
jgi:hypothetical protein